MKTMKRPRSVQHKVLISCKCHDPIVMGDPAQYDKVASLLGGEKEGKSFFPIFTKGVYTYYGGGKK